MTKLLNFHSLSMMIMRNRVFHKRVILVLLGICLTAVSAGESMHTPTPDQLDTDTKRYTVSTDKSYDDVIEDIEFAISQNNYRITGRNDIGNAISRRSSSPYPDALILHFCSLQAAKEIYDINPNYLLHMPCRIAVRKGSGAIIIEARLIPENDPDMRELALEVNRMMRRIADYGAD